VEEKTWPFIKIINVGEKIILNVSPLEILLWPVLTVISEHSRISSITDCVLLDEYSQQIQDDLFCAGENAANDKRNQLTQLTLCVVRPIID